MQVNLKLHSFLIMFYVIVSYQGRSIFPHFLNPNTMSSSVSSQLYSLRKVALYPLDRWLG